MPVNKLNGISRIQPISIYNTDPKKPKITSSPAQQYAPGLVKDSVHISISPQSKGPKAQISFLDTPETSSRDFGSAVKVDRENYAEFKRFLGKLEITPNQEKQIRAAEAKAFSRFLEGGYSAERGSIQAKIKQSMHQQHLPGLSEHIPPGNITDGEKKEVMKAIQKYGEDLASIGIMGRDKKELQRYLEDKFFITLFDRDKDEFEDYFKNGFKDFMADSFGSNNPDNDIAIATSSKEALVDMPDQDEPRDKYKIRYFKPRLGISAKLDWDKVKLKPKVDLVRLNGPAHTEVRLTAEAEYEMSGKFEPEIEIRGRRILNHKPGEYGELKDNIYAEATSKYDFSESTLRTTFGLRKQLSPDASAGIFGLYSQGFEGDTRPDFGGGINYQNRWN